jgi:hypothetical protein
MIYPNAKWRPLFFASTMPARLQKRAVILHTNGGGSDLYDFFNNEYKDHGSRISSHFQIFDDGSIEQYIDTAKQAYGAYISNSWAVQVETEDDGHPERPWTDKQLKSIISICRWLKCPARHLLVAASEGVGWHQEYDAWNEKHHNCPGPVRVAQIKNIIIPALSIDFRPLKRQAVIIADKLNIKHHDVNITVPNKGPAFEALLKAIANKKVN